MQLALEKEKKAIIKDNEIDWLHRTRMRKNKFI
jgi:hypothetical protein